MGTRPVKNCPNLKAWSRHGKKKIMHRSEFLDDLMYRTMPARYKNKSCYESLKV